MNKELEKRYVLVSVAALIIALKLGIYIFLRRGYFTLYIFNKVLAGDALILLGLVLLLGPLSRMYQRFDRFLLYRKELGIVAFVLSVLHGIISLFFLPSYFPLTYFGSHLIPFLSALTSTAILSVLFVLSFERIIAGMERKAWWRIQYWGVRIGVAFGFLHVALAKYPGWLTWLTRGGSEELFRPHLPPASLLVALFCVFVGAVRMTEAFGSRISGLMTKLMFAAYLLTTGMLFLWGPLITPKMQLSWDVCIKMPGSLVTKSYPSVCVSPDGRRSVQPLTDKYLPLAPGREPQEEYYGTSTLGGCAVDNDCQTAGCNSEICEGKNQEALFSICSLPDKATPKTLGYACGCVSKSCRWNK